VAGVGTTILRKPEIPSALRALLVELFGEAVDDVHIVEHSLLNRLHFSPRAVTRRNTIHLRGDLQAFWADPELVVHEYFHVLRQWADGYLNVPRYIRESCLRGYWNNRYEIEARAFAARFRHRYAVCLRSIPVSAED
jgi:Domain of unknown function (DUF4157)